MMTYEEHIKLAKQAFMGRKFSNEVVWECWREAWLSGVAAEREACADAVAKERERCAKVCEEILHPDKSAKIEERANWYAGTWACAAAIKRGE